MTLLPSSEFGIRGAAGKAYDVEPVCTVPGCGSRSVHVHHMWPRSFLRGQPYEWVSLPDGTIVGNRVGMCVEHHDMVTGMVGGHRARIAFTAGVFFWETIKDGQRQTEEPLVYQPPGVQPRAGEPEAAQPDGQNEVCPSCGHRKEPKRKPLPARKSKTWTIDVPDDAEIGADVLDEWVVDFAAILGFGDERSRLRRYHTLALVLAWAIQNRSQFIKDISYAVNA